MNILITGGNGLLGRHLVLALRERQEDVRVLALPAEDTHTIARATWRHGLSRRHPSARHADRGDHRRAGRVPPRRHDGRLAANPRIPRGQRARHRKRLPRGALAADVTRVVHVSSWTVYGMALGKQAREDCLLKPFAEPYAITKAEGDLAVQRMVIEDHLPAVIIRPGTFFGPGDALHFGRIADRLRAGKGLIVGPGDNPLPFVYVTDVVQGLLLALDHEEAIGQAYNITNDHPLTQQQFLDSVADEIGATRARLHVPYAMLYAAERIALTRHEKPLLTRVGVKLFGSDNRHSIAKARRELGYEPQVDVREGVRRAAEWYGPGAPMFTNKRGRLSPTSHIARLRWTV